MSISSRFGNHHRWFKKSTVRYSWEQDVILISSRNLKSDNVDIFERLLKSIYCVSIQKVWFRNMVQILIALVIICNRSFGSRINGSTSGFVFTMKLFDHDFPETLIVILVLSSVNKLRRACWNGEITEGRLWRETAIFSRNCKYRFFVRKISIEFIARVSDTRILSWLYRLW